MSQDEDKSQKTQPPTEQKLQELRRKGEIPRSNELNSAIALSALCLFAYLFGAQVLMKMGNALTGFFSSPGFIKPMQPIRGLLCGTWPIRPFSCLWRLPRRPLRLLSPQSRHSGRLYSRPKS